MASHYCSMKRWNPNLPQDVNAYKAMIVGDVPKDITQLAKLLCMRVASFLKKNDNYKFTLNDVLEELKDQLKCDICNGNGVFYNGLKREECEQCNRTGFMSYE